MRKKDIPGSLTGKYFQRSGITRISSALAQGNVVGLGTLLEETARRFEGCSTKVVAELSGPGRFFDGLPLRGWKSSSHVMK